MTLENIVAWLKALDPELSDCIAAGSIDGSKEKFVGVYNDSRVKGNSRICLGGAETGHGPGSTEITETPPVEKPQLP